MKTNSMTLGLAVSMLMSLFLVAAAPAQTDISVFTGKFALTNQVEWGKTVLPPGNYTITIGSSSRPMMVSISDGNGRYVARFMCGIDDGKANARNELLIGPKSGRLRVYAFALASLGRMLIYDRTLERKAVMEARASQTVPVMLAKR